MINLLIMILMAMSNGTECKLGKNANSILWMNAHPYYHVVYEFDIRGYNPSWLINDDSDPDYYLFVFKNLNALEQAGVQHGKCFQNLGSIQ